MSSKDRIQPLTGEKTQSKEQTYNKDVISTLTAIDMVSAGFLAGSGDFAFLAITDALFLDTGLCRYS